MLILVHWIDCKLSYKSPSSCRSHSYVTIDMSKPTLLWICVFLESSSHVAASYPEHFLEPPLNQSH